MRSGVGAARVAVALLLSYAYTAGQSSGVQPVAPVGGNGTAAARLSPPTLTMQDSSTVAGATNVAVDAKIVIRLVGPRL